MSHSKIINNLYVGNQYSTSIMKRVDTIVSVGCKSKTEKNVNTYKISVRDSTNTDLTPYLTDITKYMDDELNKNHRVLVHCKGGMNRSPAIIVAYLCKYKDMTIEQAKQIISKVRPAARFFKQHYMDQIEEWLNIDIIN